MSATAPKPPTLLDLEEQIARIQRSGEETRKFVAEQHKLMAEGDKLRRDRFLAPVLVAAAVSGAVATLLPAVLRAWGVHL